MVLRVRRPFSALSLLSSLFPELNNRHTRRRDLFKCGKHQQQPRSPCSSHQDIPGQLLSWPPCSGYPRELLEADCETFQPVGSSNVSYCGPTTSISGAESSATSSVLPQPDSFRRNVAYPAAMLYVSPQCRMFLRNVGYSSATPGSQSSATACNPPDCQSLLTNSSASVMTIPPQQRHMFLRNFARCLPPPATSHTPLRRNCFCRNVPLSCAARRTRRRCRDRGTRCPRVGRASSGGTSRAPQRRGRRGCSTSASCWPRSP